MREKALGKIKGLIRAGARSSDWVFEDNVEAARKAGHPEPEFLEVLSKVISDEGDAKEPDGFEVWVCSVQATAS